MTELPPPADPVPQPEQPPQFVPVILPPPAAPPPTGLKNPQILAAVITGFISLLVAIVGIIPSLIDKDKDEDPTPTYTAVVALIVSFTPSEVPTLAPTELPTLPLATQPTQLPPTDIQASIPTIVDVGTTPLPVIGSTPDIGSRRPSSRPDGRTSACSSIMQVSPSAISAAAPNRWPAWCSPAARAAGKHPSGD